MVEFAARHPSLRPVTALVLLTVEYLIVSFFFDAYQLVEAGDAFGGLGWMGLVGPAIIAFGTALWILSGAKLRKALASNPQMRETSFWPRLTLHIACFAGFFAVTALLFGRDHVREGIPGAWVGLWLLAGAATAVSLVPIALGDRRVVPLLRELAIPLALARPTRSPCFGRWPGDG
jgi:hypothetical protein